MKDELKYTITDLIKAYKLGYADRNNKSVQFNEDDPEEYLLRNLELSENVLNKLFKKK